MRIHLASDHEGYQTRDLLAAHLRDAGGDVVDHGVHSHHEHGDYPNLCSLAATAVAAEPGSRGVLLGGSGDAGRDAASSVPGARVAAAGSVEAARESRTHDDANVLSLEPSAHSLREVFEIVQAFLDTPTPGQ